MKKFLFIALFCCSFVNAQQSILSDRKNEVRFDIVSLLFYSKVNISYEHFMNKRFSLGLTGSYGNSNKINSDFDAGFRNNIPKYEVIPYARYNLSKGQTSFYFAEIFADANGGDFKEIVRLTDNNIDYFDVQKSKYSDFALGGALGYKMYFKEKFALEFLVGFGRNLTNTDKSPDYMQRVGLSFGYRF